MSKCLKKIVSYIPRWETYKDIYQITIFRYLVLWFSLVPVISGIVSQLPSPLIFNLGGHPLQLELTLPFNWQILWLSSLFFVISLLLYQIYCPKFIKKYNNYGDYLAYHHDFRWMTWEAKILLKKNIGVSKFTDRIKTKGYASEVKSTDGKGLLEPFVTEKTTDVYFVSDNKTYRLSLPHYTEINSESVLDPFADKGMFYEVFGRYSESKAFWRFIILVLALISLGLFFVVLFEHIYTGWLLFCKWCHSLWSDF